MLYVHIYVSMYKKGQEKKAHQHTPSRNCSVHNILGTLKKRAIF